MAHRRRYAIVLKRQTTLDDWTQRYLLAIHHLDPIYVQGNCDQDKSWF